MSRGLIEFLIVVAIIGIIAAVAIPSLKEARAAADRARAEKPPERMRLDYTQGRWEVWCDTARGMVVYRSTGPDHAGIAAGGVCQ